MDRKNIIRQYEYYKTKYENSKASLAVAKQEFEKVEAVYVGLKSMIDLFEEHVVAYKSAFNEVINQKD